VQSDDFIIPTNAFVMHERHGGVWQVPWCVASRPLSTHHQKLIVGQ
jgi:hypothetical protein